jgi:hypothetical protein
MESFGLATAEALGRGLPVAGFADCPRNKSTGSYGEKWRFGQWNRPGGILSRGIACLVIKSSDILNNFCPEHVLDCWERLIEKTISV